MKRLLQTGLLSVAMVVLSLVTLIPPAGATGTAVVADWISSNICNYPHECYIFRLTIYRNASSYYADGMIMPGGGSYSNNAPYDAVRSQIDNLHMGVPGDILTSVGPVNYATRTVETKTPWVTYTGDPYNIQARISWSIRFSDGLVDSSQSGIIQYGHFSY